ncbi:MAG: DUF2974 domain-containing protein [Enterococcus sp.]|nr:DUF2974 domain-containing protein [Enterococcus sp.]
MSNYSGKERVEIAKLEYEKLMIGQELKTRNKKQSIGYVSQTFNKITGEQSFVITDHYVAPNASLAERETVKEVTVLYRGSTAPSLGNVFDSENPTFWDFRADWVVNDMPTALQVLSNGGAAAMPQLQSSADTLQEAMKTYPNAVISVYGHSLGAMDGQYAISDLPEEFHERVDGVYVYQGPNIYSILNERQQKNADKLTNAGKIFNFIDTKDIVPIGYSEHKKQVGTLIEVESKKVGMVDQHMWEGYQFDKDGNILSRSTGKAQLAQHETNKELARLTTLRKQLIQSNGGLSSSQEIFLDAMQAKAITSGYKYTIQAELDALTKWLTTESKNAHTLWTETRKDARRWGEHLTAEEELEALASGHVTEFSILRQPVNEYEAILTTLKTVQSELDELLHKISTTIEQQVATDQELANYLF